LMSGAGIGGWATGFPFCELHGASISFGHEP
jgi:hypothetical protein